MSTQGIIFFVEGDTEVEFIRAMVQCIQRRDPSSVRHQRIVYRNAEGIKNFQNKVFRIFKKQVLRDNPGIIFDVALCYDTDVFEYAIKPPVNWKAVENDLKGVGANQVIHVKARHSIEDWFLKDYPGVLAFLRLPQDTPFPPGSGIQKLKSLFKKKKKVYMKGSNLQGFIDHLDIDKIVDAISPEIKPLIKALSVDSRSQLRKK